MYVKGATYADYLHKLYDWKVKSTPSGDIPGSLQFLSIVDERITRVCFIFGGVSDNLRLVGSHSDTFYLHNS